MSGTGCHRRDLTLNLYKFTLYRKLINNHRKSIDVVTRFLYNLDEVDEMKRYRNRIADIILQDKLEAKGAVLIEGTKWCGKTTTASQIAKSILYMARST